MNNNFRNEEIYNKLFDFWKLEEFFAPEDFPNLVREVKRNGKSFPLDRICNKYTDMRIPLEEYKTHNEYLKSKEAESGEITFILKQRKEN